MLQLRPQIHSTPAAIGKVAPFEVNAGRRTLRNLPYDPVRHADMAFVLTPVPTAGREVRRGTGDNFGITADPKGVRGPEWIGRGRWRRRVDWLRLIASIELHGFSERPQACDAPGWNS
jgi:hypothetical protein